MLSDRVKNWSIWKILIIFNLVAAVILFLCVLIFYHFGFDQYRHSLPWYFDMVYMGWEIIPFIPPFIILFFAWKYVARKLNTPPYERNMKLNIAGKIVFWLGITLLPLSVIISSLIPSKPCNAGWCISPGFIVFAFLFL